MSEVEMSNTFLDIAHQNIDVDLPLRDQIKQYMDNYYGDVSKQDLQPEKIYQLFMESIEEPLINATMDYTAHNQSNAAAILGINRGTFRKKLAFYGMLGK